MTRKADLIEALMRDVEFDVECMPEDVQIEGNALASGDDDADRECEQDIMEQLASGNQWAWCTVRVVATLGEFSGDAYLGCCSYASEADFKAPGGYFDDMKSEALDDLRRSIESALSRVPAEYMIEELRSRGIDA